MSQGVFWQESSGMQPHQLLELEFADFLGLDGRRMVACNSGTAALHLALESLPLAPGSQVIVPNYTMIACARAVSLAGHEPVFVDCDARGLIDPVEVESAITQDTAAILVVHLYGRIADRDTLGAIARAHGLEIIEDLAEAHGIEPHWTTAASCWSLYQNKVITSGSEGGLVHFRDPECTALARQLRCLGFTPAHDYDHLPRGHNYRLADPLADSARQSLAHFPANVARRRRAESWYDCYCPEIWKQPPRQSPWVYDLHIPGLRREKQGQIVGALRDRGIEARRGFLPMSVQREYRHLPRRPGVMSQRLAEEVFYLPLQPGLVTEESAKRAFEIIHALL